MATIYEKPVHQLMKDMVKSMGLAKSDIVKREQVLNWFKQQYPKIKEGTVTAHLIRLSTNAPSRLHYSMKPGDDDVFFQLDGGRFRLFDPQNDPAPITEPGNVPPPDPGASEDCVGSNEFAYEHDLRDYLARNLPLIELGLRLYDEEGVKGIEFPVGGRFIDILAMDKAGNYVVVELKVSRGYDRVVGQLLRYMAWIRQHHADPGQAVRGVIISREISEDLRLACSALPDVALLEYQLSVTLKKVPALS